jgi:hypothetical protein
MDQMDPMSLGLGRNGRFGISCTGATLLDDWVPQHPAPKLIIHRPIEQVEDSLKRIDMPALGAAAAAFVEKLDAVDGMHIEWRELFVAGVARKAWKHLKLPGEFNTYRHAEMVTWAIEPKHDSVIVKLHATREYLRRIKAAI